MKAAVIETPGRVVVQEVPDPQPAPDEVIVSVALAGLCGTDLHIYAGEINSVYPIIPGHEVVGTIAEVGDGVTDLTPGMHVTFDPNIPCGQCHFCRRLRFNHCLNWQGIGVTRDGGFAERVAVPAKVIYPIGDLPFERAVFIEPLSCVVYGLQRATPALGDRALIFGAGPIGLLLMQAIQRAGAAQVVVTDLQVLWVTYAHLGLVPMVIPLTVIIRGALTDSVRNVALQHGQSAHSMMRSAWGRWLVASGYMRTGYGVAKAVAFTLLALALGLKTGGHTAWYSVWGVASVVSWMALAFCIVRGLPVLIEARGLFQSAEFQVTTPPVSRECADEPRVKQG